MTTALIDADIVAYRAAVDAEKEDMSEEFARASAVALAEQWANAAGADDFVCCLSWGGTTFRHTLYPAYKAHRKDKVDPIYRESCKEALITGCRHVRRSGLEADDLLGILATNGRIKDPIIVSIDKDLRQVPCRHFNPDKAAFHETDQEMAEEIFLYQWVCGDTTDNYPGIPGIGPKKAQALIEDVDNPYEAILAKYAEKGISRPDAIVQGRLARIVTSDLYDVRNNRVLLWNPPS